MAPDPLGAAAAALLDRSGLGLRAPVAFEGRAAVLVGNTRALWPPFVAWLRGEPARVDTANPLDAFVAERLAAALRLTMTPVERVIAPYERDAPDFIGLSERAGLLRRGAGGLGVHPVYGPWVALRALIVHDTPASTAGFPEQNAAPAPPCPHCATACGPAFAALTPPRTEVEFRAPGTWEAWAAARAACPLGAEHRYDADQLRYHYTHDHEILRRLAHASP